MDPGRPLRRALEGSPLVAAVFYTVVGVLPLYLLSAQAVLVRDDLDFGPGPFGLIVSCFFLAAAIASKGVGPGIDRRGPARGLRLAMVLTVVASLLIATVAHRWEVLALLLAVSGVANSYGQVGANLIVASRVDAGRHAVAFSAKQSAVPLSAMLSGFVVPLVGPGGHWRWAYVGVAAAAAVLLVGCPRWGAPGHDDRASLRGARARWRGRTRTRSLTPALLVLMLSAAIAGGSGNAVAAFTTAAAVTVGFTPSIAGLLLTLGSVTAIVARIASGLSADARARTGLAETVAMLSLGVAGLLVLGLAGSSPGWFVTGLMLTFAGMWGWQGVMTFLAVRTIDLPAATTTGALFSGVYLGTVVGPAAVGVLVEQRSYPAVFLGLAGVAGLALSCVVLSRIVARRGQA